MRLPNSYGSCTKLSGKRRRPWMVRKTVGFDENDKQIMQVIGYYATKAEALTALAEYNANPTDLATRRITFSQIYELWKESKYAGDETIPNNYIAAYNHCEELHNMQFADIKAANFQAVINNCEAGYSTKKCIKIIINQLTKYALANDIVVKDYAQHAKLPSHEDSTMHQAFSDEALKLLWKLAPNNKNVQTVLILCYTGMRPSELCKILRKNVHLEERYILGGIKTNAGKNRAIPIAEKIYPFVKAIYDEHNSDVYFFADPDTALNYNTYRGRYWDKAMSLLPKPLQDHKPHDGRHTCATLLDNAGINQKIIKLILGHSSKNNVTEKVYTHKTIEQLIEAINKI